MSDKFKNRLIDKDTEIVFELVCKLHGYDVMYEKWLWDGFWGDSIIFINDDIALLTQSEIEALVRSSTLFQPDSKITYKKSNSGFTFVNFNFWVKD